MGSARPGWSPTGLIFRRSTCCAPTRTEPAALDGPQPTWSNDPNLQCREGWVRPATWQLLKPKPLPTATEHSRRKRNCAATPTPPTPPTPAHHRAHPAPGTHTGNCADKKRRCEVGGGRRPMRVQPNQAYQQACLHMHKTRHMAAAATADWATAPSS